MTKVNTLRRSDEISGCTPLQCYQGLRSLFGERDAFILESLAGPKRDVKVSVVGFNRLAEVSIKTNVLRISGEGSARARIDAWVQRCTYIEKKSDELTIEHGRSWEVLRSLHNEFAIEGATGLGFLAFLSYDAAWHIEELPRTIQDDFQNLPEICLVLWQGIITFKADSSEATLEQLIVDDKDPLSIVDLSKAAAGFAGETDLPRPTTLRSMTDSCTSVEFIKAAQSCLEHISAGDIYQIQLGHELRITSDADPFDVYRRLRKINPSPYMSFAPIGSGTVIGASPELFVRKHGAKVTMRPIAGTKRRTGDPEQDALNWQYLVNDEKERAEHIMLIDLCRNDIGRVCVAGTLNVDEQMIVEQYSHVFHLVSNVQADLSPEFDIFDLICATFPAGTMTGTPKVRAMELIESFETSRRGLYAGALGMINLNGDAVLSLTIRTAVHVDGVYSIRASAGIVADSTPEAEWQETLHKLAAGYIAITGEDFKAHYQGTIEEIKAGAP